REAGGALGGLAAVADRWPQLAAALPRLSAAVPAAVPALPHEQERARLFEQAAQLVAEWTEHAPLLLVLDDLHWADSGTLDLVHHLVRVSHGHRLLLFGTYREIE